MTHMAHVDGVDLAPGQSVAFAPGGYHLMLMHRTQALHVGEEVPVTLQLQDRPDARSQLPGDGSAGRMTAHRA